MGLMPKQTKAENKIRWGFTLQRMTGLMVTIVISSILSKAVHKYLAIPFMIFCVVVYLISQIQSPTNPKKKFISGMKDYFFYLISPKKYYSADCEEYDEALRKEAERIEKKQKAKKAAKE